MARRVVLSRDMARRVNTLVDRMEARPVNDPPERPQPFVHADRVVVARVTSETPTDGMYPCVWRLFDPDGVDFFDPDSDQYVLGWLIGPTGPGATLGLTSYVALLVGVREEDGRAVFAAAVGSAGGLPSAREVDGLPQVDDVSMFTFAGLTTVAAAVPGEAVITPNIGITNFGVSAGVGYILEFNTGFDAAGMAVTLHPADPGYACGGVTNGTQSFGGVKFFDEVVTGTSGDVGRVHASQLWGTTGLYLGQPYPAAPVTAALNIAQGATGWRITSNILELAAQDLDIFVSQDVRLNASALPSGTINLASVTSIFVNRGFITGWA